MEATRSVQSLLRWPVAWAEGMAVEMEETCVNLGEISEAVLMGLRDELGVESKQDKKMEKKKRRQENEITRGFMRPRLLFLLPLAHCSRHVPFFHRPLSKALGGGSPCGRLRTLRFREAGSLAQSRAKAEP